VCPGEGFLSHAEVVAAGYVVRLVSCYKIVLPGRIVNKALLFKKKDNII
jgi:hypothetical protein